ncbi:MAG: glycosyltransferase family 4 protein [Dermatophilaceae bacterium]
MKVLVVLGRSAGGVGRHVAGLTASLVRAGHHVVVAAPADVLAAFDLPAAASSTAMVELGERPRPRQDARAVRQVAGLATGADVVHAHGLRAAAVAALATTGRGAPPVVATLHNAAPSGRLTGLAYAGLERVVALGCDLVLGVSADLVQRMTTLGARRTGLAVVAAPPRRAATRDRETVRAALGLEADTALAVVLARLAPQKGLDLLLDAHERLRDLDHDLELTTVVAGDGPLRATLQARIDGERLPVRLLGHRGDVPDLLAAADLVVSSARWEGQPVGLQEALHAGAAVVATDVGGTAATVGDAALLVPPDDAAALARAVRDVIRHGTVRDDLRSKAVEQAGHLPTETDTLEAALAAYRSVRPALDR